MDTPQRSSNSRFPTAKITALARWKSLTRTITPRRQNSRIDFPPSSWEIDKLVIDSNNRWEGTNSESPLRTPSEEDAKKLAETVISTEVPLDLEQGDPEPLTFAQRIRDLIESLPLPSALASSRQPTEVEASEPEHQVLKAKDGSVGPTVPPGVDQELVLMLSSEEVMNGHEGEAISQGTGRQSIWNILSNMNREGKGKEKEVNTESLEQISPSPGHTQDGLMMYAPLEPVDDSQVELAEVRSLGATSGMPSSPVLGRPGEDAEWVPSTTQISVYTAWWGYRLYLPPSVMSTLDSVSLKATAQAAMITGVLKWLINKTPEILVPVQFRPALGLLKRLSPVVGYIGVFIAWSWGRIKKHDKGNGVVLTATWLLPVALIPMAWDAGEIYGPILLPKPEDRVPPPSAESDEQQHPKEKKKFWFL